MKQKKKFGPSLKLKVILLSILMTSQVVWSGTLDWTGASKGNWHNPSLWSSKDNESRIPVKDDDVTIRKGGVVSLDGGTAETINSIWIGNGKYSKAENGLVIGPETSLTTATTDMMAFAVNGGHCLLNVQGHNASFTSNGTMNFAGYDGGYASLVIEQGGALNCNGRLWLGGEITGNGVADVDINSGGVIRSGHTMLGNSTAVINGAGSAWYTTDLWIGLHGDTDFTISDQGRVSIRDGFFGTTHNTAKINITGEGSELIVSAGLWLAGRNDESPSGFMTIENGGKASASFGIIGSNESSNAVLTIQNGGKLYFQNYMAARNSTISVTGENSLLTSRSIFLEDNSDLTIGDDGEVKADEIFLTAGSLFDVQQGGIFKLSAHNLLFIDSSSSAQFADDQSFDGRVVLNGVMTGSELLFTESSRLTYQDGAVINGDIIMSGTLSCDNNFSPYGNLTVNGNYIHKKDGVYVASIDLKNMTSNHMQVNGHLKIDGGKVVALWKGHVRTDTEIHLMDGDTVEGSFDTVEGSTALVKVEISDQSVIFTRHDYISVLDQNDSPNLSSVSSVLDDISLDIEENVDMYDVLAVLDHMMTDEQLMNAYAHMTPGVFSAYPCIISESSRYAQDVVLQRIFGQVPDNSYNIYIVPFGGTSEIVKNSSPGYYTGHKANTSGVIIGMDRLYGNGWMAGIGSSMQKTTTDWTDSGGSSGEVMIITGNVLTGYVDDCWDIAVNAGFGVSRAETDRRIVFSEDTYPDDVNRTAESDFNGIFGSAVISGGYNIPIRQWWLLRPGVSLRYIRTDQNAFREHNADSLNLTVEGITVDRLESSAGLSLSGGVLLHNGMELDCQIGVSWLHHFIKDPVLLSSELEGGGSAFITEWTTTDRDRISFDTSLKLSLTDSLSTSVAYEYVQGDIFSSHTGYVNINYNF